MPVAQLDQVRKQYGAKVAVEGLSLSIERGSMFGLLGPNGSGKTSTIRMMIGMTAPDSGGVSLFGQPFSRSQLARVGFLPEERGLYKKMKVLDQLVFLGRLHGLDASTARSRSVAWCERLQVADTLSKKTEDLSKGMQQKIQFIAALLHDPDLIIMDEPFSGLDPVNAQLLMDVLIDQRAQGKAVLFSTHRMDQVEKFCDSIALLSRGKLLLSGTMREIKTQYPRNRVEMIYTGEESFLDHPSVQSYKLYEDGAELTLHEGRESRCVLRHALDAGTNIVRFEVMEPTLEEIFIERVKASFSCIDNQGTVDA
jgi:ABC-2 type transport system ATP-binding protein